MNKFTLNFSELKSGAVLWPKDPIRKVLVIGHGALATRQRPTYEHWLAQGIDVHCADIDKSRLDDCLDGIKPYVLPQGESRLLAKGPFDLLCVNNIPDLHMMTALQYGTYARRIVIQKPQDLNLPLIQRMATAAGFEPFRQKAVIHDHYRNKSAFAALLLELPAWIQSFGRFRRVMFFLTESKSVSDEPDRAASLECGMIQDLAVHQLDLMLECLLRANEWSLRPDDNRINRRIGAEIEIVNCVKLVDQTSILGDDVETFAAIDLRVTEQIEFPAGSPTARRFGHQFDVLIVVGKGLAVEQGVVRDLKSVAFEFTRQDAYKSVDLATLSIRGLSDEKINRKHGGMNRPLMIISPNPPEHALEGAGGQNLGLWQTLSVGQRVAEIASRAKEWSNTSGMASYQYQRPLGDLIRDLASPRANQIRSLWGGLPPLDSFQDQEEPKPKPPDYCD